MVCLRSTPWYRWYPILSMDQGRIPSACQRITRVILVQVQPTPKNERVLVSFNQTKENYAMSNQGRQKRARQEPKQTTTSLPQGTSLIVFSSNAKMVFFSILDGEQHNHNNVRIRQPIAIVIEAPPDDDEQKY